MQFLDKKTYEKIKNLKICIVTGTGDTTTRSTEDMLAENDTERTSRELMMHMLEEGFKFVDYFTATPENLNLISELHPNVFINLTEGIGEKFMNKVCLELEKTNIPFTGSRERANEITTNKYACKTKLVENQIQTPRATIVSKNNLTPDEIKNLKFPLIVKPVFEDGSTGISQNSVCKNEESLQKQIKQILETYDQPAIVEEYINGRELSVTLVNIEGKIEILPIAELAYKKINCRKWNIYSYTAKWHYDSEEYAGTPIISPPKNISSETEQKIKDSCEKIFKNFEILDYARIDFRLDEKTGIPYVIDINTNPSLEIDAKYSLAISVQTAGLTMSEFVALIIKSTIERYRNKN